MEKTDKREIASAFRERLREVIDRRGETVSAFARRCGLDRSALSNFLDAHSTRLPRSETLAAIATAERLSIDWLLGLSQDEGAIGEVASVFSIEQASKGRNEPLLSAWHNEAAGYKIRYSPSSLPDLLRTPAVIAYEFNLETGVSADAKEGLSQHQLDYTRLPETDMEVILPYQRLENLANGADIWSRLERGKRQAQLVHMADLLEELYPTFRLFLYDGRTEFVAPYTIFGPKRAALYIGQMYMVVNSVDHIRQLTKRFDDAIRGAVVAPDRAADWISSLKVQ